MFCSFGVYGSMIGTAIPLFFDFGMELNYRAVQSGVLRTARYPPGVYLDENLRLDAALKLMRDNALKKFYCQGMQLPIAKLPVKIGRLVRRSKRFVSYSLLSGVSALAWHAAAR